MDKFMSKPGDILDKAVNYIIIGSPFFLLALVISIVVITGKQCDKEAADIADKRETAFIQTFSGNHELRKLKVNKETNSEWNASYFLIGGSASGKTVSDTKVSFSWKLNNNEYIISDIALDKIRLVLDDSVKNPYIKFKYKNTNVNIDDIQLVIDYYIDYIVVHCKESDFPVELNINDL
jgi:hypothetical protein